MRLRVVMGFLSAISASLLILLIGMGGIAPVSAGAPSFPRPDVTGGKLLVEVAKKRSGKRRESRRTRGLSRDRTAKAGIEAEAGVIPPLPDRRPVLASDPKPTTKQAARNAKKSPSAARDEKPPAEAKPAVPFGPPPPPPEWTEAEIKAADAACAKLLGGTPMAFEKLPPIREGVCGDPAPILLKGFSDAPNLSVRPPATVNCKLTAALRKWFTDVVQPRAKELLHANVIRLNNASAYVCRTRYSDPTQRMSEHAYANAFDVSEFITAKGERITVLEHWNAGDERAQFLKDIHAGACKIFGTTLGPEANEAHRNHFHFDMAKRRGGGLCDFPAGRREEARKTPVFPTVVPAAQRNAPPVPKPRADAAPQAKTSTR